MKQIVIIHDKGYADIDKMLNSIDYVSNYSKSLEGDFEFIILAESVLNAVFKEAGLPFKSVTEWPIEPDVVIAFSTWDENSIAYMALMKQRQARKPVYAFQLARTN